MRTRSLHPARRTRAVLSLALLVATTTVIVPARPAAAATGDISTVAGNGTQGSAGDGGAATSAQLYTPDDVAVDSAGNLYIADRLNRKVRKVSPDGIITTFAGNGNVGTGGDGGPATSAQISAPTAVAVDAAGNVYIANFDRASSNVRKVDTSGTISTVAGSGPAGYSGDGGPATLAQINLPRGLAFDAAGNLYIADTDNHRIRRVDTSGIITTVAGVGVAGSAGDGGPATSARLNSPHELAFDAAGNLYIADTNNHRIRRIDTSGTITTFAGTGSEGLSGDGGAAKSAMLDNPEGVAVDSGGNVYIGDTDNHSIRKVDGSGTITTFAGSGTPGFAGDGGPAIAAKLRAPQGLAIGSTGNLFIADTVNDRIRMVAGPPPPPPTVTGTTPVSPANNNAPLVKGTATTGTAVRLYTDAACTSPVAGTGSAATFASPGIAVSVADNTTTTFHATASAFNNTSACSASSITYVEDSTAPAAPAIDAGPGALGSDPTPAWSFSGEPGGTFECQLSSGATVISAFAACSSPKTYDLSAQPDGTYTFSVRQLDAAGNTSAAATSDYTLDRTAPAAPTITSGPGPTGSDLNPTWAFSGEPGATFECQLSSGGTVISAFAPCTSPHSYDLSAQPDGTYRFSVRQRDAAGNTSPAATTDYELDRTAPAEPVITAGPGPAGPDANPAWTFTGDPGATFECQLSKGGTVLSPLSPCSSPQPYDLSAQPDATYTFSVRQVDGGGNQSAFATSDYVLDRAAPAPPTITSGPGATGNNANPAWGFSGEAGAVFECQLSSGATVVSAFAPCTSPHSYDLSAEPDGAYTFSVRQRDAASNVSAAATSDYTLDRGVPAAPTITSSPGVTGNNANPAWGFSGEAGAVFECQLSSGATVISAFAGCTSPHSYDLSAQSDGTYTFSVRQRDAAGNVSPAATSDYTLDRGVPAAPTITSTPGATGNKANPTWGFSGETGAIFECQLSSGATVVSAFAPCTSPHSYDLSAEPDATYTFSVRQRDAAGNTSAAATSDYALDRGVPAAPTITSSPGATGNDANPAWSFTGEPGAGFECRLVRGATVIFGLAACPSPQSYDLSAEPDATYTFSVRQIDVAGNKGPFATSDYALDRGVPRAPIITADPGATGNDANPAWSFTGEAGASFECQLSSGATVVSAFAGCTSPKAYDLSAQPDGTYTFSVRQRDAAGNTSAAATSDYALDRGVAAAPTVTSSPGATGSDATPTWAFTGEGGAMFECQLSSGGTVIFAFAPCTSPHSYDLSAQADATYTFSVRQTDPAANTSTSATSDYTLDRSVPAAPTITAGPGSTGSNANPAWSFTGEPGAAFECQLSSGGTVISGFAACSSPTAYDLSAEPDGTYTFSVRQRDAAGNVSAAATSDYTLDRGVPAAPTITSTPGATGNDANPTWSFTGEAGAAFECQLSYGATVVSAFGSCSSPKSYDLSAQPDATYNFSLRQRDAAGNTSAAATSDYTLDRGVPTAPTITANPGATGNDANPAWSFTGEAGATFECQLSSGATVISAFAPCTSPHSYDLSAQPDGTYIFSVRQRDAAGNTSTSVTSDYVLDRDVPSAPMVTAPVPNPGNDATPSWFFAGEPGAGFECRLTSAGTEIAALAPCASPATFDLSAQPDGTFTLSVRQKDAAGNPSTFSSADYVLDRSAPTSPALVSGPGSGGSDPTPTWVFSGEPGATFLCELRMGSEVVSPATSCTSPASYDLSGRPDGTYTLVLVQTDAAGNTSTPTTSDYTLDRSSPPPPPGQPAAGGGAAALAPQAVPETRTGPTARTTAPVLGPLDGSATTDTGARSSDVAAGPPKEAPPEAAASPQTQAQPPRAPRRPSGQPADDGTTALEVLAEVAGKTAFPFILVLIVVMFLAIQDRIDRNDPKLALAPVRSEPLDFIDPSSLPIRE